MGKAKLQAGCPLPTPGPVKSAASGSGHQGPGAGRALHTPGPRPHRHGHSQAYSTEAPPPGLRGHRGRGPWAPRGAPRGTGRAASTRAGRRAEAQSTTSPHDAAMNLHAVSPGTETPMLPPCKVLATCPHISLFPGEPAWRPRPKSARFRPDTQLPRWHPGRAHRTPAPGTSVGWKAKARALPKVTPRVGLAAAGGGRSGPRALPTNKQAPGPAGAHPQPGSARDQISRGRLVPH